MMYLDKRIPQGFSEPFSIINRNAAEPYVGELCWFTNYVAELNDVDSCVLGYLTQIHYSDYTHEKIFECRYANKKETFRYCIPCDFTPLYRPFYADELINSDYGVGKVIVWREKGTTTMEAVSTIIRMDYYGAYHSPKNTHIQLGTLDIDLESAYRKLEVKVGDTWVPFGVKKDEIG